MYVQDTLRVCWSNDPQPVAKPAHTENKAAARRRRQMERQQQRRRIEQVQYVPVPQIDEALLLAIEQAHDIALARSIERALEPSTAPLTESTTSKRVTPAKLAEWFQKWRKPILSWLRNRAGVPSSEVDDLAQEVFVRLLRYSDQVLVDNPQGYLFRIASNVASEWRERACIRYDHEPDWLEDLTLDDAEQPEAILEREFEDERVQAAVSQLPPRQRMVLLARVHDDLTYKQVAQRYGLTDRIVLRDVTRAYSALRAAL